MMRRHLAAVVVGLLGLAAVLAAPAGAHDGTSQHSMMWMDLDPNDSPNNGDKLYGIDFAAARATFDDKVRRWRIEMRPTAGGEPAFCDSGDYSDDQVDAQKNPFTFRCNWDTTRLGDMTALEADHSLGSGPIAPNGEYTITVTAWNVGRPQGLLSSQIPEYVPHVLPTRTVIIQNPVSAPTGVSRSYDSTTGKVTVTWAGSSEPDIQKYIVQEKVGSGGWADVGERPHGATSFDRQITEVGTYQYRVSAVRPEVAQSGFTEAAALEVAAPPPPPSAPSEEAQGLGPEPGVTDLSPPTTATTVQAGAVARGRPVAGRASSTGPRPARCPAPPPRRPRPPRPTRATPRRCRTTPPRRPRTASSRTTRSWPAGSSPSRSPS